MHHLQTEDAFLADLHDSNITVMSDGNGGPLDVQFAFVDSSGLLKVRGPERQENKVIKAHLWCFLSTWSIVRVDKGHRTHLSSYATQIWVKMQDTAQTFSQTFRQDLGWRPEEILRGLQKDVQEIQERFEQGIDLQEQCRMMKQEALTAAISRQHQHRQAPRTAWEDSWNPPTIPPWDQGRVPAPPDKSRVPPKMEGRVPFSLGTPPRQEVVQQKARPRPLPPANPPPRIQQNQVPQPKPVQKEKGTSNSSGRAAATDAKKSTSSSSCGPAAARSPNTTNVREGASDRVEFAESTPTSPAAAATCC